MKSKALLAAAIISGLLALCAHVLLPPLPPIPIGSANGRYYSSCCGTMTLEDGRMNVKNQTISYVIERGKDGPYVLPSGYVGVSPYGGGFVIYPRGGALMLPLDLDREPAVIILSSDRRRYTFTRQ